MLQWYWEIRNPLLLLQTLLALPIFSAQLRRRSGFWWRVGAAIALGVLLCQWTKVVLYRRDLTPEGALCRFLVMGIVYLCTIAILYVCYEESCWTALLVASSCYLAQNLCGTFKTLLRAIPAISAASVQTSGVLLLDFVCYGGGYLLLGRFLKPYVGDRENMNDRFKAVFSFLALMLCIGMARIAQDNAGRNALAEFAESIYQILCDAFLLLLQFGVMERTRLNQNVETMRELLHQQHTQYETSKETMQLVNEKYHDLKQLLQKFQGQVPQHQLEKLEQEIGAYDAYCQTGNKVLDVTLAEKRIACDQKKILLTCYAGGQALDGIEELDLYSLLNNTLNNAIKAVSALPQEKRFVTLTAKREEGMLSIHAENPCVDAPEFRDGLPVSRRNADYHGFGMKSMQRIVEKYGGSLAAKCQNEMFYLDMVLFAPD